MPKTRAVTLSSLVCLLVERVLPDAQQRYVLPNLKSSEWLRKYSDFVPNFLRGRPRSVILHCLDRQSRSSKYCSDDIYAGWRKRRPVHCMENRWHAVCMWLISKEAWCSRCHLALVRIGSSGIFLANTSLLCLDTTQHGTGNLCLKCTKTAPIFRQTSKVPMITSCSFPKSCPILLLFSKMLTPNLPGHLLLINLMKVKVQYVIFKKESL